MSESVRHHAGILLIAGLVMFARLGAAPLWDEDEPRNATCAREMLARGDWIVPTFNHELRTDKPVLLYWLTMSAYALLGPTEFAARFWSALLAVGTALVTYHLGRLLYDRRVGFWSAIILVTTLLFGVAGRAATPDSTLIFFSTLALLAFVAAQHRGWNHLGAMPTLAWTCRRITREHAHASVSMAHNTTTTKTSDAVPVRLPILAAACIGVATGLAVLAKGPIGFLGPIGVIGLYGASRRLTLAPPGRHEASRLSHVRNRVLQAIHAVWSAGVSLRPLVLVAAMLAVAAPWYIAVGLETDGAWLRGFLLKHNVGRFQSPMEGHDGSVLYYLPAILIGFFPWSVFLPLSLWTLARSVRREPGQAASGALLLVWIGLYVGVFSLAGTKLPSYVLPTYPALAIVTARWLEAWRREPFVVPRGWPRAAFGTTLAVGVAMLFGLPRTLEPLLAESGAAYGLLGLIPLLGASVCLLFSERWRAAAAQQAFAGMAVALSVGLFAVAGTSIAQHQASAPLALKASQRAGETYRLATFKYSPPSAVFYGPGAVTACHSPDDVAAFFRAEQPSFLIVDASRLDLLQDVLPPGLEVISRQRKFLRREGEIVLLGRRHSPTFASPEEKLAEEKLAAAARRPSHVR